MKNSQEISTLNKEAVDYVIDCARAAVGPIPIVGPLLTELVGHVIPNQRIDRIARFAGELERKIQSLEAPERLEGLLQKEAFTELLEEGIRQAARSLSDERRTYIASLITNSMSSDRIDAVESRHLLRILEELNDIEVLWLRYYYVPTIGGDEEFRESHKQVLDPAIATLGSSQEELDRSTLQASYKEHLYQLGLLERRYRTDFDTDMPEFDKFTGQQRVTGYEITSLGRLLLREVGLVDS